MPLDIYIYLKGGRGDGFVPQWNGSDPMAVEEGTLANGEDSPADGKGREVSEPYRDIFPAETQVSFIAPGVNNDNEPRDFIGSAAMKTAILPGEGLFLKGGESGPIVVGENAYASIFADEPAFTTSDEVAHTAPRQFTKVCTWLVFTSVDAEENEYPFKFRKADVVGWGTKQRTD